MFTNETLQLQIPDLKDKEMNSALNFELTYNGQATMPYFMTYD
jgi:hypothetical protein